MAHKHLQAAAYPNPMETIVIASELMSLMNRPELIGKRIAVDWLYVVRQLLKELGEHPKAHWSLGEVTHVPKSDDDRLSAIITLTINHVSIPIEIGVVGHSLNLNVSMGFPPYPPVTWNGVNITERTSMGFKDLFVNMINALDDHVIQVSIKAGRPKRSE